MGEDELIAALQAESWDVQAAAKRLGMSRSSLYDRIEKSDRVRTAGQLTSDEIAACYRRCSGDLDVMSAQLEVSRHALRRRIRELDLDAPGAGE